MAKEVEVRVSAREHYLAHHGPDARRRKEQEREAARAGRTPQDQLELLGQRPGESRREKDRLWKKIGDAKKPAADRHNSANEVHTLHKDSRATAGLLDQAAQEAARMGRHGKEKGFVRPRHACGGQPSLSCPACQMDLEEAANRP